MEDVQYLLRQGAAVEQSFLFVVDSAMRDHVAYPSASEYYIPFPISFKQVFAVDLVDASIPRTEYSVESHSNTLAYAPGAYASYDQARLAGELVHVRIAPGDYNAAQLVQALNAALAAEALDKGHTPLVAEPVSDPIDLSNKLKFTRPEPFVMFMGESTIRKSIGFGQPAHALGASVNWDGTLRYSTDSSVANDIFASVSTGASQSLAFAGPVPIELTEYTVPLVNKVRQTFTAAESGLLYSVVARGPGGTGTFGAVSVLDVSTFATPALVQTIALNAQTGTWTTSGSSATLKAVSVASNGTRVTVETQQTHGLVVDNIVVISNAATLQLNGTWKVSAVTSTTFSFASTITGELDLGNAAVVYASKELLAGTVYALEFQTASKPLYKAETFSDDPANKLEAYQGGSWRTLSTVQALSVDVHVSSSGFKVEAPGQCNLTGERYVLVRSPDIEQHMHRDLAAAFDRMAPGLGLLKLNGMGFREERFNFLAYRTRKFHPIGKLKGLRIRLETREGRLYDSHGIDHTLLLCVKMYAPGPSTSIPRDLYPSYTPDPREAFRRTLEKHRAPP